MTYQRRNIVEGGFYHVVNRGAAGMKIFKNREDYFRLIHDLFEFNDQNPLNNTTYSFQKFKVFARPKIERAPRKLLVEILAFCLMPNHYHLFLRALTDQSITQFIKRLNMGYAKYFNEKYKRNGALFQGRFKSVPVMKESHFIYLPYYIHLNPLDLVAPEWRRGILYDYEKAVRFLEKYRWSSHLDYIGRKNFPSVTQRDFLLNFFEGPKQYHQNMISWLKNLNFEGITDIMLE